MNEIEMTSQSPSSSSITIEINNTIINKEEHQGIKEKNEFERNIILAYQSLQSSNNNHLNQMQMSNSSSSSSSSITYLMKALDSISQLNTRIVLNNNTLDKLTRISSYGIYYQITIGKIYLQLFEQSSLIQSLQGSLLITYLNQVLNLLEAIKSTSIEYALEKKSNDFISSILNITQLDHEQRESLKQFMSNNKNTSKHITRSQIDFSSFSNMLLTLNASIEKIHSLQAQYEIFIDNIDKFISLIQSTSIHDLINSEKFLEFGDILMAMLFTEATVVLYQNSNDNEQTNVMQFYNCSQQDIPFIHRQSFTLTTTKDIQFLKEQIIPLALAFIQKFSAIEDGFDIQYICFMLLRRLYLLFPTYSSKFSGLLAKVAFTICTFDTNHSNDCRQLIRNVIDYSGNSQQYYELKRVFIEKREQVINDHRYKIECNDDDFVLSEPFGIDGIQILDYDLKVGMFNYVEIQAGEKENIYIEINHPYSLIDFCVLINDLDLNIVFYYLKLDSNSNNGNHNEFIKINHIEQMSLYDSPKKFLFFISSPGILKVVLDNSYSWFKSKSLFYKANVLCSSNTFDILRTLSVINFKAFISKEIDINSFSQHSNKVIMFKLGKYNKAFNAAQLLNNITKYNRLLNNKAINQTFPIFIKGNIIWEINNAKNRLELTKEAFDLIIDRHLGNNSNSDPNANAKFTIINIFNMSNEDKMTGSDMKELLPFSIDDCDFGDRTIVLKSNFGHCCLMLQIYYYVLDNKYVNDYLLFIHCGEFGFIISVYQNGVIDYIPELNSMNDLTTTSQKCQLIADYYNNYDYPKQGGIAKEKEVIEILISGIKMQCDDLANGLKKAQWNNNIEVTVKIKEEDYIQEVINASHFFLLSD